MEYRVIISPRAEAEFEHQLGYLLDRSTTGAQAWSNKFEEAVKRLSESPERHGLAPENADHEQEIRQVIFKTRLGIPIGFFLRFVIRTFLFCQCEGSARTSPNLTLNDLVYI